MVMRRTLQRGSTVEDLEILLKAADEEVVLPTAGTGSARLEGELEAGLRAVKMHRREREGSGVQQVQQLCALR